MTVVDLEWFTLKNKSVTYIGAFVKLYNLKNGGQIYEIHEKTELKKMRALTAKNSCNLGAYWIIEILLVVRSVHVVPKNQDKFVFYVNNYIDWDQFNQLYNLDWMKKRIRNVNAVAGKLRPASTRATNNWLKAAKKEMQKKEEIIEKQKAEAMAAKQ